MSGNYPAGVTDNDFNDDPDGLADDDDDEVGRIPCCNCGKPTTWDPIYNDLCYRCIRADNE